MFAHSLDRIIQELAWSITLLSSRLFYRLRCPYLEIIHGCILNQSKYNQPFHDSNFIPKDESYTAKMRIAWLHSLCTRSANYWQGSQGKVEYHIQLQNCSLLDRIVLKKTQQKNSHNRKRGGVLSLHGYSQEQYSYACRLPQGHSLCLFQVPQEVPQLLPTRGREMESRD